MWHIWRSRRSWYAPFVSLLAFIVLVGLVFAPSIASASASTISTPAPGSHGLIRSSTAATLLGGASYNGGNDQATGFALPLLRTDSSYDSIIHLQNATAQSSTVDVTYYNADGSAGPVGGSPYNLGAFASLDIDVGATIGTTFDGSAIITATSPINVVVDTINPTISTDNVDSYAAIPGIPMSGSAPFQAYLPGAKSVPILGLNSVLDLQNTSDATATVTLTFVTTTTPFPTASVSVPAHATSTVDLSTLSQVPTGWVGTVEVSSDQPIAALSELSGSSSYATVPMTTTTSNSSFYIPRFDVGVGGWTSAVVIQNTANTSNTFTATFYNVDGSVAATPSYDLNPGQAKTVSTLTGQVSLPNGFTGSAVITDDQGSATALALKLYMPSASIVAMMGYMPPTGPPTGGAVTLTGLRNGVNNETTGIALQNTTSTSQTYTITYDDATSGTPISSPVSVTVPAGARWFGSQADVSGLTMGAAQVTNASGPLPAAIVELYAGMTAPSSDSIPSTPTATVTNTPTASPTSTNTSTPTVTSTPTSGMAVRAYIPVAAKDANAGW